MPAELQLEFIGQLALAILLGTLIGIEREFARKSAGMRTYALVSMGAALFAIIPQIAFSGTSSALDPSRVLSQIVVGIGFIGAGVIIFQKSQIRGITTAAGLWVTAGIGAAVGYKLYNLAICSTLLVLLVLVVFWSIEKKFLKKEPLDEDLG
ncbi:MAG TPA: MgtC/SapB family protein [Candidatus Paceibacterota bacterium]|nr:MgtC/SapB family protein [Candidatus Paceibacterota bacterium]